jgi:predicted PurR-regulated permease PerM
MLYIGQGIILPVIYATIFSILISPLVNFLIRKKINRIISITLVLLVTFLIAGGIIALISTQASLFSNAFPQLLLKFQELLNQSTDWVSGYYNISPEKINSFIESGKNELLNHSSSAIGVTLSTMGGFLTVVVLIPVYIFMLLYYQPLLSEFIHKLFGANNGVQVAEILVETKAIIQSYLSGLFIEFVLVAVLNAAGLLLLGINYAILLGIIGALLNVIPYIGGIVAVALIMAVALVTKSGLYALYALAVILFIQFIDNNYIIPKIIGSKVKLNSFICLVAVLLGDALWGVPGMFLSIPLTAIVKLIFDRIESLKPWGYLLGDSQVEPTIASSHFTIKGFIQNRITKKKTSS